MNQNIKEFIEEFEATYEDFRHNISRVIKIPATVVRWLLVIVVPIYFGAHLTVIIEEYVSKTLEFTLVNAYNNWLFFVSGFLFLVGLAWRTHQGNRDLRLERLYHAMRWFYEDLEFDKDLSADIRCTLWTPYNSKVELDKMKIIQLVDYVPRYGKSAGLTYWYRINKHSGRIRKVARVVKNETAKPIGIAGRCIFESSVNKRKSVIMYDNLNTSLSFEDCMMQIWNFTKAETKRLTKGRQSYMCIVLMNSGQTDILGLIFVDSMQLNSFNQRTADKAEKYLPRIAELLVN